LPNELSLLSDLRPDLYATSKSAVDLANDVLIGRPFGGTARPIFYGNKLATRISISETYDPRLCAIMFNSKIGPLLFVCCYSLTYKSYKQFC